MVRDPGEEHANNGHQLPGRKDSKRHTKSRLAYSVYSSDFGFMPYGEPLPFWEAVRQLPRRYRLILSKPGPEVFAVERGQATWQIVCLQLIVYSIVACVCGLLRQWLYPEQATIVSSRGVLSSPFVLQAWNAASSWGLLLSLPIFFLSAMGLLYGLARAYGGHGIFVQQVYTTLLFLTPCGLLVSILGLVPLLGSFLMTFLGAILLVYGIILQAFATVVVHQVSGGKATAAVVLAVLLMIPVVLVGQLLWTLLFAAI